MTTALIVAAMLTTSAIRAWPSTDEVRLISLARIARAQQERVKTGPSAAPPPAAAPRGVTEGRLDRQKFDRVYAAAVAARRALFLNTRSLVAQQAFATFANEATMARDRASTASEKRLAGMYGLASGWTENAVAMMRQSLREEAREHLETAVKAIDAANAIYLGKRP